MSRIFQILTDRVSDEMLLRFYLRTGQKKTEILNIVRKRQEALLKKKGLNTFYSLAKDSDVAMHNFLLQVNVLQEGRKAYSVSIHTDLTYIRMHVHKEKGQKNYVASVQEVITYSLIDYDNLCKEIIPYLFIEFIAYSVKVEQNSDCTYTYVKKDRSSFTLRGPRQRICSYANGQCFGDIL